MWQINTQAAIELSKKVDGVRGEQEARGNILRNTIYCRRDLSKTWGEFKRMLGRTWKYKRFAEGKLAQKATLYEFHNSEQLIKMSLNSKFQYYFYITIDLKHIKERSQ